MKKTRLISGMLATALMTSVIGALPVMAEDDPVVYTYTDEAGKAVNITQSEIDAEHWNVDALGSTAPFVYEDFPAYIEAYVDDYANLQLRFSYLKDLSENDSADISIADIATGEIVFESSLYDENLIYTDPIEIGAEYKVTLSETIDGVTSEYYKRVITTQSPAEMPDYMVNSTASDSKILVANIADLKASEVINENGEIEIDGTMPRYTKVEAEDFNSYINSLDNNATYKVYTKDESDVSYTGFISKDSNGSISNIYIPTAEVLSWSDTSAVSLFTSDSDITASAIKSASKIEMTHYRDYSYSISSTKFRVYTFKIDSDTYNEPMQLFVKGSDSLTVQIWSASSLTGIPTKKATLYGRNGTKTSEFLPSAYGTSGGYLFFVVYFAATTGKGLISVMPTEWYSSADVTGSTYEAYQSGGSAVLEETQYYIYDIRDTDVFYINYKSTQKKYKAILHNDISTGRSACDKCMEITYYTNQDSTFTTSAAPDDIISVPAGTVQQYNFVAGRNMEAFVCVYGISESEYSSLYALEYSPK